MTLRKKLIRLAYENPELREALLPLLGKTAVSRVEAVQLLEEDHARMPGLKKAFAEFAFKAASQFQAALGTKFKVEGFSFDYKEESYTYFLQVRGEFRLVPPKGIGPTLEFQWSRHSPDEPGSVSVSMDQTQGNSVNYVELNLENPKAALTQVMRGLAK